MYDHIQGELVDRQPGRVVVRTAGVGYELKAPLGCCATAAIGSSVLLHTILHVVEGMPTLLGFEQRSERELARRLMTVSGVGPALTLTILSTLGPTAVQTAIAQSDHAALKRIKGVGTKTAERLCLELRDQIGKLDLGSPTKVLVPASVDDAIAALVTLGYADKEATEKVRRAHGHSPSANSEQLIKTVLRGS